MKKIPIAEQNKETKGSAAARKMSIAMLVLLLVISRGAAWWGALLTLHTYVQPKLEPKGFRIFGFRLSRD